MTAGDRATHARRSARRKRLRNGRQNRTVRKRTREAGPALPQRTVRRERLRRAADECRPKKSCRSRIRPLPRSGPQGGYVCGTNGEPRRCRKKRAAEGSGSRPERLHEGGSRERTGRNANRRRNGTKGGGGRERLTPGTAARKRLAGTNGAQRRPPAQRNGGRRRTGAVRNGLKREPPRKAAATDEPLRKAAATDGRPAAAGGPTRHRNERHNGFPTGSDH